MQNFIKHPIIAGVISAIIFGIFITPMVAHVSIQLLVEEIMSMGKLVIKITTVGIPVWLIILLGFIYYMVRKLMNKIVNNIKPEFTSYKDDIIEGVKWEWEWNCSNYRNSYDFSGDTPIPICNNCKGYLIETIKGYASYYLECENCGFNKSLGRLRFKEYRDKIKREILRRVKIEKWKADRD